jgi:hypothetical protein
MSGLEALKELFTEYNIPSVIDEDGYLLVDPSKKDLTAKVLGEYIVEWDNSTGCFGITASENCVPFLTAPDIWLDTCREALEYVTK